MFSAVCAILFPLPGGEGQGTVVELSPAAKPHPQALNLNPNLNLARLKALEIKSKITIKIKNPTDRPNSTTVGPG